MRITNFNTSVYSLLNVSDPRNTLQNAFITPPENKYINNPNKEIGLNLHGTNNGIGLENPEPSINIHSIFSDETLNLNNKKFFHTTEFLNVAQEYLGIYEITSNEYQKLKKENPNELTKTQYYIIGKNGSITDQWCAHTVSFISKKAGINIGTHKSTVQSFINWAGDNYKSIKAINMTKTNYLEERKSRAKQIKEQLPNMHEGDFIVWKSNSANNKSFMILLDNGTLEKDERSHIGIIEHVDTKNGIVTVIEGNANESVTGREYERITVKTKEEGIYGNQNIGEYQEINRRDGLIRKQYTIEELANFGYSGYIDNSLRVKKI